MSLVSAIKAADEAEMRRLVAQGDPLDRPMYNGYLPLFTAARVGRPEVIRALLELGADPGQRAENLESALHYASTPEAAQVLLDAGADVNAEDDRGRTALHAAAADDQPQVVAFLAEQGARLDTRAFSVLHTPLMAAADQGHWKTVKVLLGKGAGLDVQSRDGYTALMLAVSEKSDKDGQSHEAAD